MTNSEIQELIKLVSRTSVTEVEIEKKDFKLTVKSEEKKKKGAQQDDVQAPMAIAMPPMAPMMQQPMAAHAPAPAPAPAAAPEAPAADKKADASNDDNLITIKAPMIGTFYRKPSPDKDVFVNVGDTVKPGDTICIIEAMKLFNEIECEVSGKVVKVLVDDSTPVEYDQPLYIIEPA